MSEKPVEERLSVVENDIEHIKSTLDRVEGSISDLHNDIHNTQTQNNSNINALRSELKQDIEANRKEIKEINEKLDTHRKEINEKLDAHRKEMNEKLDENQKEMREFFTSTIARLEANQSKLDDNQRSLNEKHARLSRDLVWLYIMGLSLFGTTVANANGWLSFIGKLFSAN